jgi:hypothetical protein
MVFGGVPERETLTEFLPAFTGYAWWDTQHEAVVEQRDEVFPVGLPRRHLPTGAYRIGVRFVPGTNLVGDFTRGDQP